MTKKVIYVTGSRAEYGVMRNLLQLINVTPGFDLSLIITGMHTSKKHGNTIQEILQDKLTIRATINQKPITTVADMARSLGELICEITDILEEDKPDIILLAGDRNEALAGAIAGAHMNTLVAHISGGDITSGGHIDEITRHAISKYAHIHFPASQAAANILVKMGENTSRIFIVGNPGIPTKYYLDLSKKKEFAAKYGLDLSLPVIIVLQHSCSNEVADSGMQMKETMDAIRDLGLQSVVIYPNNDAGSEAIIEVIEQYSKYPFIRIHKNLPRDDFLILMATASVMVGNSSSGLIETPAFSLPTVNIGTRQCGRERSDNVLDVDYNREAIKHSIKKALYDNDFRERMKRCSNPYTQENTEQKIVEILGSLEITDALLRKNYTGLQKTESRTA